MPYIGNTIRAADDYRLIDDISSSFNGSTTSFALQVAGSAPVPFPKSPQQVLISVNGVIQEPDPTGSSGFNLVGTNIVFSSAPTNGHAFFGIIYATADYLNAGGNFPAGSLGAPSLTFIGDENTGIYRKGSGSIGFVADATEVANTDSNGLTISSGDLILGDNRKAKFGASDDLQIFHDGSNSFINEVGTGGLFIRAQNTFNVQKAGTSEFMIKATSDGAVELYFDNAKKAETVTGGFTVTGVCTATSFAGDGSSLSGINTDLVSDTSPQLGGNLDVNTKNIVFGDSAGTTDDRLTFGAGTDLKIYSDGTNGILEGGGSGGNAPLFLNANTIRLQTGTGGEKYIDCQENGAVELYHNNSKKFETTSIGVTVTGGVYPAAADTHQLGGGSLRWNELNIKSVIDVSDNGKIRMGDSDDLQIYHSGSHSYIQDAGTGSLILVANNVTMQNAAQNENMFSVTENAGVELFFNNVKQFETVAGGAKITGGDGHSLTVENGGTNQGGVINLTNTTVSRTYTIAVAGNTGSKGANSSLFIADATAGVTRLELTSSGHLLPFANNTYNLGSSSKRWANLFVNDLKMSNKGKQNDIDQTWGDYTIQEGYEDLFLINHRTGKKFKFNLTEVG